MYRQNQQKAKEHIIAILCKISDKYKFDIDTTQKDEPIIVGYGPDEVVFRTTIEKFHLAIDKDIHNNIAELCEAAISWINESGGYILLIEIFGSTLRIYGISVYDYMPSMSYFYVISKDGFRSVRSYMHGINTNTTDIGHFICPFMGYEFRNFVVKEQLISPFLLLLDPVSYFKRYSNIIQKYPQLGRKHTWGVYELLLEYFPEMNEELFSKYLGLKYGVQDICPDILNVIGGILIELYV